MFGVALLLKYLYHRTTSLKIERQQNAKFTLYINDFFSKDKYAYVLEVGDSKFEDAKDYDKMRRWKEVFSTFKNQQFF